MAKKIIKNLILIFIFGLVLLKAGFCYASEIDSKDWPNIPFTNKLTETSTFPDYIVYFFALGIFVGGVVAAISLSVAGVKLIMSAGNPDKRSDAISMIKGSIIGLFLLLGSFIIITTINPSLETLTLEPLSPVGGIQLVGKSMAPAPINVYNLDSLRKDYDSIVWPKTVQHTDGSTESNCDPNNPNATYIIYWYKDTNFKNFDKLTRLQCNNSTFVFGDSMSYKIVKEQPGVYFFDAPNCQPKTGSDGSSLPQYYIKSIPEWVRSSWTSSGKVRSIRIVNGPDSKKGPFFGVVWFNGPDYKTSGGGFVRSEFQHFKFSTNLPASQNYSQCISESEQFGPTESMYTANHSYVIYKWVGFDDDGDPIIGNGVTLYSRASWTGGSYTLTPQNGEKELNIALEKVPVSYQPNTTIPQKEQEQCAMFTSKYYCLQSFEIKGPYLVLISNIEIEPNAYNHGTAVYAQAFPISLRIALAYENKPEGYSIERGTPELASEYITSGSANYIEIIPLAENLSQ